MASNSWIFDSYRQKTSRSAELFEAARTVLPGGIAHDARYIQPHPVYVDHAAGSRKWDVDGNEYIDYFGGHGALLLGHNNAEVTAAVSEQLQKGTHFGACHELEVRWAQQIRKMLPSAELIRFTNSGTEATMLAFRLARAFTERSRVLRFKGHFHGWQDYATVGVEEPYDIPTSNGVPEATRSTITALPTDLDRVRDELEAGDVAAVIVEPSGAGWGAVPIESSFVKSLRELTVEHDTLLILDEVVTGFRMSPGGFQVRAGITPDLTTMAKIVAGGLPGGVVGGRAEIMDYLEKRGDPEWDRGGRVSHPGTYNGNPLSAAAGVAVLEHIADGAVHRQINSLGERLRQELQSVFDRHDVGALVYGETSYWHLSLTGAPVKGGLAGPAGVALQRALIAEGVHIISGGGFVSAAHTEDDIDQTADAFDRAIRAVASEGLLG